MDWVWQVATFCGDEKFQHHSDFISKLGSAQAQWQLNFLKEGDSPYFRAWELLPMFNAVSRDLVNSHPRQNIFSKEEGEEEKKSQNSLAQRSEPERKIRKNSWF